MSNVLKKTKSQDENFNEVQPYNRDVTIKKIDTIDFENGHVMPNSWFHHVCLKNGKADTIAVFILSEIVGFYKSLPPANVTNLSNPVQYPRVYKACIQTFIDIFEFSPKKTIRALDSLEANGFIVRQFEEPNKKRGKANVTAQFFVMPVADAIKKITYLRNND